MWLCSFVSLYMKFSASRWVIGWELLISHFFPKKSCIHDDVCFVTSTPCLEVFSRKILFEESSRRVRNARLTVVRRRWFHCFPVSVSSVFSWNIFRKEQVRQSSVFFPWEIVARICNIKIRSKNVSLLFSVFLFYSMRVFPKMQINM